MLFLLLCLAGFSCLAEEAAAPDQAVTADAPVETTPEAPVDAPPPATSGRATISRPPYTLTVDSVRYNILTRELTAEGNVELDSPYGQFTADRARCSFGQVDADHTLCGELEGARGTMAPFQFRAKRLKLDTTDMQRLEDATVTTCTHERPHYHLQIGSVVLEPDRQYEARRISVVYGGRRLFTIPKLRGEIDEEGGATTARPPLMVGVSDLDGVFASTAYTYPLSDSVDLALAGRYGTKQLLRGEAALVRPFKLMPDSGHGTLRLRLSQRDDTQNRVRAVGLQDEDELESLLISRLPLLQASLDPIPLPGDLRALKLRLGGSAGRYKEEPTGITQNRGQIWATLITPAVRLGRLRLSGEFGAQQSFYRDDSYRAVVSMITLESPRDADYFASMTYTRSSESGRTPFLFDRVVIPEELQTQLELPVTGSGHWRLGVYNRLDLENNESRDLGLTAIYRQDCLSYGLSYNTVDHSFNLGLVLNAFGDFRRSTASIGFPQ